MADEPRPKTRPRSHQLTRRAALKALGAGAGAAALLPWLSDRSLLAFARIQETGAAPAPKVLPAPQFAALEALVEAIIPADERSPGAREARVADYIDLLLSESADELKLQWIGGLAALDDEARSRFDAPFAKLDVAGTDAVLAGISANETAPATPLEAFFVMAKHATIQGYYTSEIGIHQELQYKGNTFLPEFVGCETEEGTDCRDCGQKAEQDE